MGSGIGVGLHHTDARLSPDWQRTATPGFDHDDVHGDSDDEDCTAPVPSRPMLMECLATHWLLFI